jgi:hypothetical protein
MTLTFPNIDIQACFDKQLGTLVMAIPRAGHEWRLAILIFGVKLRFGFNQDPKNLCVTMKTCDGHRTVEIFI